MKKTYVKASHGMKADIIKLSLIGLGLYVIAGFLAASVILG